jgi:hypothetical protein
VGVVAAKNFRPEEPKNSAFNARSKYATLLNYVASSSSSKYSFHSE